MTKYILNSGNIKSFPKLKKKFHQEIVKGLNNSPKILLCNFAQAREFWEEKFPKYSNYIKEDMPNGVDPTFELAMPDEFIDQCKKADVIYFHGGDDHLLKYWMSKFNMPEIFKNKVIATNSASSDMLSVYFWTCDWRQRSDGFGILPIKFIPHYQSDWGETDPRGPIDWQAAYDELKAYGDTSLPIHAVEEGKFVVINQ